MDNFANFLMPLSSKNNGISSSMFSVPTVKYSKETREFVDLLMRETRLTTSQRKGFNSILRSSKDVPGQVNTSSTHRRMDYMEKRLKKAATIGINLPSAHVTKANAYIPSKRSLGTIKASGALDFSPKKPTYIPVDKDLEKLRFGYKMTYGKEPTKEIIEQFRFGKAKRDVKNVLEDTLSTGKRNHENPEDMKQKRFKELLEEIEDRVDFYETMKSAKKEKSYKILIVGQIREKIRELKKLFPEEANDVIKAMKLDEIDPIVFATG